MQKLMLALVLSVLSVTTAAAQTAFTGVNVIGCNAIWRAITRCWLTP
jgi:hypothetical protein